MNDHNSETGLLRESNKINVKTFDNAYADDMIGTSFMTGF